MPKGNSRSFIQDHGWYIINIEFQPSGFSKGTHLNIGVQCVFYPKNHFAFSYGYREKDFKAAENEEQFSIIIHSYCDHIITTVSHLNGKFCSLRAAARTMIFNYPLTQWSSFDIGIVLGLTNKRVMAWMFLKWLTLQKCSHDYELERREYARGVLAWLKDTSTFSKNVAAIIAESRRLKKLPVLDTIDLV